MEREAVTTVLNMHDSTYKLVLWLAGISRSRPEVLAEPELLRSRKRCLEWLHSQRAQIPGELYPAPHEEEWFGNLFSSYFRTSFHINQLRFGPDINDRFLALGAWKHVPHRYTTGSVISSAFNFLCRSEGMFFNAKEIRRLIKRGRYRQDLVLWAYVWELQRRMFGRGKGEVCHELWQELPPHVKKNITTESVWEARERLLDYARSVHGNAEWSGGT